MARGRGLVPIALAIGFGVLNGYIVFQPAYAERNTQKAIQPQEENTSGDLDKDVKEVGITKNAEVSKINMSTNQMTSNAASTSTEPPTTSWTQSIYSWWSGENMNKAPDSTAKK
ncbi:hypothetical protein PRK78_002671 [Emydomyces testavorans]|uniref:Uncharacterized protein n=1 Tax=Emydomyces testavorans TaxID=2070801 RepID=A0AAF0IJW9_9EURO|nr:hypothetical protein PRK78_002671 [Emydomyces testavorans]